MIYSQVAKTNRVKCQHCGGTIYRGTPKVVWTCGQPYETYHPACIVKHVQDALKYLVEHNNLVPEDLETIRTKEEEIFDKEEV